eukprot:1076374-Pleurochrysis_carterae.AAC.2
MASTFETHLQLAHEPLARRFVVLLEIFHLLAVEVGIAQHCLREGFDDVDAFQLKVEERNEGKGYADGVCLCSCREAAKDPARLAAFESAIVVELNPLRLASENVLWTLDKAKGVVCHLALELFDASCALLFFIRLAADLLVAFGWR